ncbi:MAG TPA: phosphodiester glycosidase family protein [Kofleriaceae bacterium]
MISRRRWTSAAALMVAAVPPALLGAVAAQAEAPPPRESRVTVAPGLVHRSLRRGDIAQDERFRVVVGAVERQRDADRLVARLEAAGEPPAVSFRPPSYEISVAGHEDRHAAEATAVRLRERGFEAATIAAYGADVLHSGGPWAIEVLEIDPARLRVEVAHAYDAAFGVETTSALARRRGALAAINGGFYLVDGALAGDAQGALVIDGRWLSEPDRNRGSVGLYEEDGRTRVLFGRLALGGTVTLGDKEDISLSGINRRRGAADVILYTPEFHRTTLTDPGGTEVVVTGGRVSEVRRDAGSSKIPGDGFVVSFGPETRSGAAAVAAGQPARFVTTLTSTLGDPGNAWSKARWVASAGPLLLWNGRRIEDPASESISRVFGLARHPRTVIAALADGILLLVTVDGRAPRHSVGMSLGELTDLLLELGAVSALNLDGGGSTAMVIGGRLVNTPSDPAGERANGDALLVFPRHPPGDD